MVLCILKLYRLHLKVTNSAVVTSNMFQTKSTLVFYQFFAEEKSVAL
jgi:hypothetical protein